MAKKNIQDLKFKSIVGWRGDSLVCNQAFGGDIFSGCSMNCFFCFTTEVNERLLTRYYDGWNPNLVRACDPEDYRRLFDKAFGSDKEYTDWHVKCLRYGLPFNMGSKAETFCIEDTRYEKSVVIPVLELFREYNVPIILETKSHLVGLKRYIDIIKDLNVAVIISIMGGSDTLNYVLEPLSPNVSMRWALVKELNDLGIWTAVRWEPLLCGINTGRAIFEDYAQKAADSKAKHISFFNYRTSNYKRAQREFEARGFDYIKLLEKNLDEKWQPVGRQFLDIIKEKGVPVSSPDIVNFPFDSDCVSCCGTDKLFKPYNFNFQYALSLIKKKGNVSWNDMEEVEFREPESYERMKMLWNKAAKGYYSIADCVGIKVLDQDKNRMNIYGNEDGVAKVKKKKGFLR